MGFSLSAKGHYCTISHRPGLAFTISFEIVHGIYRRNENIVVALSTVDTKTRRVEKDH
jgi:hypothetical protein